MPRRIFGELSVVGAILDVVNPTDVEEERPDLRAYRFALDLNAAQLAAVSQHAGAARWAYNHALEVKFTALAARAATIARLTAQGVDLASAKAQAPRIPTKQDIQKEHNRVKGDSRTGVDGLTPWWHTVSTYAFQSAFKDADTAFKNWWDSVAGRRPGPPVGKPQWKRKHRCRDSFRLHHDVNKPTIRPDLGYRRIIVPRLGSLRVHDSTKRLKRALDRGGIIQSVTISRGGHRWYASVLVNTPVSGANPAPTRRQRQAGIVGVDVGVHQLAALSTGELVTNPRHLQAGKRRLAKAQRKLSRTEKGSKRRRKAAATVGKVHHVVAERRATTLHQLTKRLTTQWQTVAVEDLNVAGMTRSGKGTLEKPGRNVAAKSGLNRSVLDVSPGELRRQLDYKTRWYGSQLVVIDRWYPSSQTCSQCAVRTKLTLRQRVFRCAACGLVCDRDVNAAINIAAQAAVDPGTGQTLNARGSRPDPPPQGGPRSAPALTRADHPTRVATPTRQRVGHPTTRTRGGTLQLK